MKTRREILPGVFSPGTKYTKRPWVGITFLMALSALVTYLLTN